MKIKSHKTYTVDLEYTTKKDLFSEAEYDENENLIFEIHYFPNGDILSQHEVVYDQNGRIQEEKTWNELGTFTIMSYSYENDNLLSQEITHPDGTIEKELHLYKENMEEILVYDTNGNITERQEVKYKEDDVISMHFYENNDLSEWKKLKYDENGNCTKVEYFDSENNLTYVETFIFDANNFEIESRCLNAEEDEISKLQTEYQDDRIVKIIDYSNDTITVFEYDENNLLSKELKTSSNGKFINSISSSYNIHGHVIEVIRLSTSEGGGFGPMQETKNKQLHEYEYHLNT